MPPMRRRQSSHQGSIPVRETAEPVLVYAKHLDARTTIRQYDCRREWPVGRVRQEAKA